MTTLGMDPLRILLIEDNHGDIRLIQHYLGAAVANRSSKRPGMVTAETLSAGLDHLTQDTFDLILLDLGLPDSSGLETLQRVLETAPDLPVVIVTGSDDDEMAIQAVKEGAQDYLIKGTIDGELLAQSLRYAAERNRSERELRRQNERLESFAMVVSHDLRNPLMVAAGRIQLEREEGDSANLTQAADALERMETLIAKLLTLAQQGATIGEQSVVDLTGAVDRAWRTIRTETAALRGGPGLGTIRADSVRLGELLENVFHNAIRHGGEDTVVKVGHLPDGSGFFIEDDGPGIPEENREAVFEVGFTKDREGTGFGLSIVQSIVDAQGWEIAVTDGSSGGARFEISGVEYVATE